MEDKAVRAKDRLERATASLIDYLESRIRFKEWPTSGLGLGLEPEEMDELLIEATWALNASKRIKK